MSNYSTPYKSGTFNGAPTSGAVTFAVSGLSLAASDVGRLLLITSGDGFHQHREITAVSGQNITIAHPWDTDPFIVPDTASDVLPASGDSFVISYHARELVATDADMTLTDTDFLKISGSSVLSGGACIYFQDLSVEYNSNNFRISDTGAAIFGYYKYVEGEDGYVTNSCSIRDVNLATSGLNTANNATGTFGLFDIYGGAYRASDGGNLFLRCYKASNPTQSQLNSQCRWINLATFGVFGSRVDGKRSILIMSCEGAASEVGQCNPMSAVARTEFSGFNSLQALYLNFETQFGGPNGQLRITRVVDCDRGFRAIGNGGAGVWNIEANIDQLNLLPAVVNFNGVNNNQIMSFGNFVEPKLIDTSLAAVTGSLSARLVDNTGSIVSSQTITNGLFSPFFARHTDLAGSDGAGDRVLADGTEYANYSLRLVQFGKQFTTVGITARSKFDAPVTMLEDTSATGTKAQALALTEISGGQDFYNAYAAWLEDNITTETEFAVTLLPDGSIDASAFDVVINDNAAQAFDFVNVDTIAINSTEYVGLIETAGEVSVIGNATQSGGVIDANGIRVDITTVDGTPFNILARRTDTGAEFPFQEGITSASFQVPSGVSLEYAIWQKGKQTLIGTLDPSVSTSLIAAPLAYDVVDVSLDVAVLLEDIDVTLTPTEYSIIFNEPMVLNIEQVKVIVHFVLSRETSLRAGLATGAGNPTLTIRSDEITVNLPTIFLRRGGNVPLTERVELTGFLNTDPAKVMNPAYVINPSAADGTFVLLPSVKPQLDATQLAKAVWDEGRGGLALDFARGANEQTKRRGE